MSTGGKQEGEAEIATKGRILIAAGRVFARCPFDMATLKMIVAESGVKHSLIMYHFGSKNNLYEEVLDQAVERYAAILEPVFFQVENNDPLLPGLARKLYIDLIELTIDGMFASHKQDIPHVNIIMMEARYPTKAYRELYDEYFKRHYDLIIQLIRTINPLDNKESAMMKLVQIFGLLDSFQGEEEGLKEYIGFDIQTDEAKRLIKEKATKNAFLIIEATP